MRIQLTRIFLILVTTLFCTIAYSSILPDAGEDLFFRSPGETGVFVTGADQVVDPAWSDVVSGSESVTQEPLLLATGGYYGRHWHRHLDYVCMIGRHGRFRTLKVKKNWAQWLINRNPNRFISGKCEDVYSPA